MSFFRNNPLFLTAVSLVIGIVIGDAMTIPMWVYALCAAVVAVGMVLAWRRPLLASVGVHLAVALMGAWLVAAQRSSVRPLPVGMGSYETVVASPVRVRGKVYQCDLWMMGHGRPMLVRASLLRASEQGGSALRVGDGVAVEAVLDSPCSLAMRRQAEGYGRWLRVHGYEATALVWRGWHRRQVSLLPLSATARLRLRAAMWRDRLVSGYVRMGITDRTLALLSAMTLGDRTLIDHSQQTDYAVSGGSHVLALSGLHLTIVYAVLLMLIGAVERIVRAVTMARGRLAMRFVAQLVTLTAVWAYVVLVGMPMSVVRAAVMLTVCGVAGLLGRRRLSANTLAFAGIVMLVANPLSLWDAGFQMSFMAVLGIVLLRPRHRLGVVGSMLWVTLSAQAAVAPLVMYYFGRFSCYFLLTSCIVIPGATLLLYGAVLVWMLTPWAAVQHVAARVLERVAVGMDSAVGWVASLPGASVEHIRLNVIQVVAIYILLLCVYRIICITLHPR